MAHKQQTDQNKNPRFLLLQPQLEDRDQVAELVQRAIRAEFPDANLKTLEDLYHSTQSVPEAVDEAISDADVIIGNMEGGNLSVTVSLGMALARNKPILLIVPAGRALSVPMALFHFRLFVFSFEEPELFIESFSNQVRDIFERETNPQAPVENNNVFISYCHKDAEFLERLIIHLRPLDKAGLINSWADTQLKAGDLWKHEIEKALAKARAAVLLVSADFMASEFIIENELPPLLKKAESNGTRIIPVIVKPCRFTRDKHLSRFQAVNDPRKALISLPEAEREEIYDKIAMEIESVMEH